MLKGNGNRILPILAAVLVSVGLAIALVLLLLREPDGLKFEEAVTSAEFALASGNSSLMKRELLMASRHAISARNWRILLSIGGRAIPGNPKPEDYKLFTAIAGRAASALPGDEELRAFWVWALMRKGDIGNAEKASAQLRSPRWNTLISEVILKSAIGSSPDDLEKFINRINPENDPEFLESSAYQTASAELGHDAALLYMYTGRPDKAFSIANDVMNGNLNWNDPTTYQRHSVPLVMASIAQDYGERNTAIEWLIMRVETSRDRRNLTWEELQMLGDFYWERFLLQGMEQDREKASLAWKEAMAIVLEASGKNVIPEVSWRIWVNQAVLEESWGRVRESRRLLDQALILYPGRYEVMSAWALEMKDDEPALSRRLARTAYEQTQNPVLGVTAIILDPESVSPRLYEARLWELFDAATSKSGTMQAADSRVISTFLLEYMASRKNYSSIDVAVERYLKVHPDSRWILSWRLAADAARGLGMLNLVAPTPDRESPYEEMRVEAESEGSWRGLHDSAMYSVMTARELDSAATRIQGSGSLVGQAGAYPAEAAILSVLEPLINRTHIKDQPIGDRLRLLFKNREDTDRDRKLLTASGNKGRIARSDAGQTLRNEAHTLRENALESINRAYKAAPDLQNGEKASLLYLEALLLKDLGRIEASVSRAAEAVRLDPEHARARELLSPETSS